MFSPSSFHRRYAPNAALIPSEIIGFGDYCIIPISETEERVFLAATAITCVSFVTQFAIGLICLRALWISRRKSNTKLNIYLVVHTSCLAALNVIGLVTDALSYKLLLVSAKEISRQRVCLAQYPADDLLLQIEHIGIKLVHLSFVSNLAFGLSGLLTDVMLIWRCRQIWKFTLHTRPNLVVLGPIALFIASIGPLALACLSGFLSDTDTLVYFAITLVLNFTLTSLILLRLWQCKVQSRETLGNGYGKHYSVLSVVFIESASMNAICSVLLLISSVYGVAGPVGYPMGLLLNVWVAVTPAVQACSNYLIIYRGTRGSYGSWSNNVTTVAPSSAVFATVDTLTSADSEGDDDTI